MTTSATRKRAAVKKPKAPALPALLKDKLYKTGMTRGADDDAIYQNRVLRTATVLIPYGSWQACKVPPNDEAEYANGFIVLISPTAYFKNPAAFDLELAKQGLALGQNALLFYTTRKQWTETPPRKTDKPATHRKPPEKEPGKPQQTPPLGGTYVARIASTTGEAKRVNIGFTTKPKGAGIRAYEYASASMISQTRLQLEALFWRCADSKKVIEESGVSAVDATAMQQKNFDLCQKENLLDLDRLKKARMLNADGVTVCPLCMKLLGAGGFMKRLTQAEGREIHDLTVTELNLFHIDELKYGAANHRPYNLGWGHHDCNTVVKDWGINKTLQWMQEVIDNNVASGHLPTASNKAS